MVSPGCPGLEAWFLERASVSSSRSNESPKKSTDLQVVCTVRIENLQSELRIYRSDVQRSRQT